MVRHNATTSGNFLCVSLFHLLHHRRKGKSPTIQGSIAPLYILGNFSKEKVFSHIAHIEDKMMNYHQGQQTMGQKSETAQGCRGITSSEFGLWGHCFLSSSPASAGHQPYGLEQLTRSFWATALSTGRHWNNAITHFIKIMWFIGN